jgi:hypothetical protein
MPGQNDVHRVVPVVGTNGVILLAVCSEATGERSGGHGFPEKIFDLRTGPDAFRIEQQAARRMTGSKSAARFVALADRFSTLA